MENLIPVALSGIGGAVVGPIVSKLLGGSSGGGLLGGLVGGIIAYFGASVADVALIGHGTSATNPLHMLNALIEGGIGGGVLGLVGGHLLKRMG